MSASSPYQTSYATYLEIKADLTRPLDAQGLDPETLKRLYQSKLVYLESLRVHCFFELNRELVDAVECRFSTHDYELVLTAIQLTHRHLRQLILTTIHYQLRQI